MNIVVLDGFTLNPGDNAWDKIEQLGDLTVYDRTSIDELVRRAKPADIVVTNKAPLNARTISQLDNLKFISVTATGYNVVDVIAAGKKGVPVSNVPIYGTNTVAQHVFAVLLAFIHRPYQHDLAIRDGEWTRRGDFSFWLNPLDELSELTLGIVGFGRIGRRVAEIANAFGMRVVASNPSAKEKPDFEPFEFVDLDRLFSEADVISLHCPQTQENADFVDQGLLEKVKVSTILINSSRGGLINDRDLADALNSGKLKGACLDVFSEEPIADNNPLLSAKNCLLTPHYAWATHAARRRLMNGSAENIEAFIAGNPINVVNAWKQPLQSE